MDKVAAARYAAALYEVAKDDNLTAEMLSEFTALSDILRENREFTDLLSSPMLSLSARADIAKQTFEGKVSDYVFNFIMVLVENKRISLIDEIRDEYENIHNEDHGIVKAIVSAASPLSEEETQKLSAQLSALTGKNVTISVTVDEKLLAGVSVDLMDRRLDGTVKNRVSELAKSMGIQLTNISVNNQRKQV